MKRLYAWVGENVFGEMGVKFGFISSDLAKVDTPGIRETMQDYASQTGNEVALRVFERDEDAAPLAIVKPRS